MRTTSARAADCGGTLTEISLASPERVRTDLTLPKVNSENRSMPPNPTPPYWLRAASAPSLPVSEPDADHEERLSSEPRSTRHSLVLLLAVFVVATVCVNLWPDESSVASSAEATGIPAEAVIASLAAERLEHSARAAATRALESATADAPASETRSQSPGGKAGSNDEQGQAATTDPSPPVGKDPAPPTGNLTLPIVGETPLPDPGVPEVPVLELPATPPLPALPDVPQVPGTLLP
jgi:hypothetical protein